MIQKIKIEILAFYFNKNISFILCAKKTFATEYCIRRKFSNTEIFHANKNY